MPDTLLTYSYKRCKEKPAENEHNLAANCI